MPNMYCRRPFFTMQQCRRIVWILAAMTAVSADRQVLPLSSSAAVAQDRITAPQAPVPPQAREQDASTARLHESAPAAQFGLSLPAATDSLEVVHRCSQFIRSRRRIVRVAIADPSIVDVVQYSPTELSVIGVAPGTTNLAFWFEDVESPFIYVVTIVRDAGRNRDVPQDEKVLERKLAVLFPCAKLRLVRVAGRWAVQGQARSGREAARILGIVQDEVASWSRNGAPEAAANEQPAGDTGLTHGRGVIPVEIVDLIDVPSRLQVMLHVWIAELNVPRLRHFGCDPLALSCGPCAGVACTGQCSQTGSSLCGTDQVKGVMRALISDGTARVVAETAATVMSGHTARFFSGGEFAVPICGQCVVGEGASAAFRRFGTTIEVTPTVLDENAIRVKIAHERSRMNGARAVGGIPGLDSRQAETTVELVEGQSLVIAGLSSCRSDRCGSGTGFLGMPWTGRLPWHRKPRCSAEQNALLILVTPQLVCTADVDSDPTPPGAGGPIDHELILGNTPDGWPPANDGKSHRCTNGSPNGTLARNPHARNLPEIPAFPGIGHSTDSVIVP